MTSGLKSLWAITLAIVVGFGLVPALHAQFETRTTIPFGFVYPPSIAVGDFNHDGKLDLAAANYLEATQVTVALGNGDGTFQTPVLYVAGNEPDAVVAADVNHDGNLDLVVGNYLGSNLAVLLGNGDGTFQTPRNYDLPILGSPTYVAVGDFNNDGNPDLFAIEASTSCQCALVFLGNGDGTFQTPPITTVTTYNLYGFAIGDFNSDGKLDLALAENAFNATQLQIFLGNGDGSFRLGAAYLPGSSPGQVVAADLNGDHHLDLVVRSEAELTILLGKGDGTFQAPKFYLPDPNWFTVGDFNGDGKPDIAVTDYLLSDQASILFGNGDGTFAAAKTYNVGTVGGYIVKGDFNGDGKTDLAFSGGSNPSFGITVLLNTGAVSLSPITPLSFPFQFVGSRSAPQTVNLSNTGTSALTISSVKATGQFGVSSTCGSSVAPGGNCTLSVTFSPTSQGPKSGTISIRDSASSKPQVIELSGAGTVVELSPLSLNFGSQKVGSKSAPQTVQLTNTGAAALSITKLIDNGADSKDFPQTNNCPSSLGAGASCTITVTFQPQKAGPRNAQISITDTGGGSPQLVPVSGTGD